MNTSTRLAGEVPSACCFRIFTALVSNGDHRISCDEFVHSVATKALREMDANKDGVLTPGEAAAAGSNAEENIPTIRFSEVDSNGDGKVSIEELKQALHGNARVDEMFRKLDRDRDGFLSESELDDPEGATLLQAAPRIRIQF